MSGLRLVLGLIGAPLAWTLHLAASYAIVGIGCSTGWNGVAPAVVVTTLVCAALAVASGVASYSAYRRLAPAGDPSQAEHPAPGMLMLIGAILAGFFTAVIVIQGVPPLMLPPCGASEQFFGGTS